MALAKGEWVGVHVIEHVIEHVIILACIALCISVANFFFYLLVVSIVGRRRLREPVTWEQFSIDMFFLSGGLGLLAFALLFVMLSQDSHDIAVPTELAQVLKVAMIALGASAVAMAICAVAILLADRFLHPPDRPI